MPEWQTYGQLCGGQVPIPPEPEPAPAVVPAPTEVSTQQEPTVAPKQEPVVSSSIPVGVSSSKAVGELGKSKPKPASFEYGGVKLKEADKELYVQGVLEGNDSVGKDWVLAGFWIRFAAMIIDSVLFVIAFMGGMFLMGFLMGVLVSSVGSLAFLVPLIFFGAQLALVYWYWIWPLSNSRQATHGKRMLGLRVIRVDGSDLTLGTAIGRFFSYHASSFLLYLGFINAGFDREKRTFHDMMCNTRVIYN